VPVYGRTDIMFFQNPPYRASRQLLIPRIAAAVQPPTVPGYGVTSAHRVEVEVGADGHASAPLSGAAAGAPPAGAKYSQILCRHGGNDVCEMFFLARKGTDGSAVGLGCWSWRRTAGKQHHDMELASCLQPCEFMPCEFMGRLLATQDGGWSQPEERHGPAVAVLRVIRRWRYPVRFFFEKYSRTEHLCGSATRSMCLTHPSHCWYPIIDMLP
jgi:hypothetical protein